jgi:hypothetical protein
LWEGRFTAHGGKIMARYCTAALMSLALATPAYAQASTPLPDPNALTLLSLGLAGLLIGRRVASRRDKD